MVTKREALKALKVLTKYIERKANQHRNKKHTEYERLYYNELFDLIERIKL